MMVTGAAVAPAGHPDAAERPGLGRRKAQLSAQAGLEADGDAAVVEIAFEAEEMGLERLMAALEGGTGADVHHGRPLAGVVGKAHANGIGAGGRHELLRMVGLKIGRGEA